MIDEEEWLTVNQAAQLAQYHPEHIRRLVRQGKINARKFSIVWQINKSSLLQYLRFMEKKDVKGAH